MITMDHSGRIFMQHQYRLYNVGESLRAINVNYPRFSLYKLRTSRVQPRRRGDALTRKLLLTYFAGIRILASRTSYLLVAPSLSSPLLLLVQSNCRIPGNLKGKIHRTSFEESGIKVSLTLRWRAGVGRRVPAHYQNK